LVTGQSIETTARAAIRNKVVELARRRGKNVESLKDSDVLPEARVLDSIGVLELIMWYETTFQLAIDQTDLTVENFGTIDAMTNYLGRSRTL
jgi:D-alanine--poly(phosphoribitol) ligase subunit 2